MVDQLTSRYLNFQAGHPIPRQWDQEILEGIEPSGAYAWHRLYGKGHIVILHEASDDHEWFTGTMVNPTMGGHSAIHQGGAGSSTESLRQRLANANSFFQRKASEVLTDEAALKLLAAMYQDVVVNISEFDACNNGISLAKLTAANFCEIGANVIYITEAGQRFIDSINDA